MKNRSSLKTMADRIAGKYDFSMVVLQSGHMIVSNRIDTQHPSLEISSRIYDRHGIEKLTQKEKIAEALDNARTQMLVREYLRPEYFIWSLELKEDSVDFGFTRQTRRNKLRKFSSAISFRGASDRLYDFFATKLNIHETDISALSKREE